MKAQTQSIDTKFQDFQDFGPIFQSIFEFRQKLQSIVT